jgi:ABC-2 type transport system ATP-binding protein
VRIGAALQDAALDDHQTGRELLALQGRLYGLRPAEIRRRLDTVLDLVAIGDAIDRRIGTYSGGMKRRLDLAAALVHRPPVLFLDEPTTGLDPRGRSELWAVIAELVADGMTLLLTTQYLEEAERLASTIVVIDGGQVIAEGTAAELKHRLGATIIEVRLGDTATAQRARNGLSTIGPTELLDDGRTVTVTVQDGGRAVLDVVRALDGQGLAPEWLTVREPTLDDVFLQLTGHPAESDRAVAAAAEASRQTAKRGAA